jgi:murein DD-endopeptidase MepM/ murein hydrolase activator NlpD
MRAPSVALGVALAAAATPAGAEPSLRLPVDGSPVVCAFYDHGGADWNCGGVRYSGHRGTDFAAPYGTPIVAAANGLVVEVEDGYFDGCTSGDCAGGPTGLGNHVLLEHPDGTRTYYGHMKTWTVAVAAGQEVRCGDRLGEVGSSGLSTGNHVHFQVGTWREEQDPYLGGCSERGASLWVDQQGYGDGGGCTDGIPAPTCAPDPACGGEMDVLRCEGEVVRACAGGRDQSRDCAAEGLACADDGSGSRCVAPACRSVPNGSVCDGDVLRACADGAVASERDCAGEGATCDAGAAACLAADPLDPGTDPDAPPSDDRRPGPGDPGYGNAASGPDATGGLAAGCHVVAGGVPASSALVPMLAVLLTACAAAGRRRSWRS